MASNAEEIVLVAGENVRGNHQAEVLLLTRDPDGPGGWGSHYDSLGVVDAVPDWVFDARFRVIDPIPLRQEYGADAVCFDGPRRVLADRFTAEALDGGRLARLGPVPMYRYGTFVVPDVDAFVAARQTPYRETPSRRPVEWVFDAGNEVYELVSPAGSVFVMQSASLGVDPDNSLDGLATLGDRLALPEGWAYRARTLEADLVVRASYELAPATIVLDELENSYQRIDTP